MAPNDAQIDLLLRRHAQRASLDRMTEHLDADELNAFAEGSLPVATRAQFVSHLADCDSCRKLATQLVSASGANYSAGIASERTRETRSWQQKLTALFAPARLRYAAFAIVLIAAASVTFVALKTQRARQTASENAQPSPSSVAEVKPSQPEEAQVDKSTSSITKASPAVSQPTQSSNVAAKQSDSLVAQNSQPVTSKPVPETTANAPQVTTSRAAEPRASEAVPSFAPPPPGETERAQNRSREPQTVGGVSGRKDESGNTNFGALDRARSSDVQGNRSNTEQSPSAANNRPAASARRAADDKSLANRKVTDTVTVAGNAGNELRIEAPKTAKEVAKKQPSKTRSDVEEVPERRSVSGHKFQRQGSAWVDTKFKSSMTVKSVTRGSDDYRALDAGIRSIAEQLGGDVLVVWKGKAYRIH